MLELVFWVCLVAFAWTYAGYPVAVMLRASLREQAPPASSARGVKVTAVVAVRNGAGELRARVQNLLDQGYPPDLLDVLVVMNGCTDATTTVASQLAAAEPRVTAMESPPAEGKAGALNRGVAASAGDVVVFADVRQTFHPDAVRRLVDAVMQPGVGAVSGRLVIGESEAAAVRGMTWYWTLETALRRAESLTGSVVGVTGAIYAIRRELYRPIPPGTILDDVYEPLRIALDGHRVAFEPSAVALDEPSPDQRSEYRRRVRTLLGNLQLVRLMPELLIPWRNPLFGRFVSHKLLRVLSPVFMAGLLTLGLAIGHGVYAVVAGSVLVLIVLGAAGWVTQSRLLAVPAAFLMIQVAALEALFRPRRTAADVWAK